MDEVPERGYCHPDLTESIQAYKDVATVSLKPGTFSIGICLEFEQ